MILCRVDITSGGGSGISLSSAVASSSSSSAQEQETSSSSASSSSSPLPALFYAGNWPPPTNVLTGLIDDASCHMEDLERANDSQLYTILQELKATAFFRTFVVDLHQRCPLQRWRTTKKGDGSSNDSKDHDSDDDDSDGDEDDEEDDEFQCPGGDGDEGGAAAAAFNSEPAAEPLCTVKPEEDSSFLFDSNALFSLSQDGFQSKEQKKAFKWKKETDMVVSSQEDPSCQDDNDEDEDSTPPPSTRTWSTRKTAATTVASASQKNMAISKIASTTTTKTSSLSGSTLSSASASTTTTTTSTTDSSTSTSTSTLLEGGFPDSFWMDMCSSIRSSGEHATVVNLARNPEHNTGYNGTHIWRAIYEENCLPLGGSGSGDDDNDDEHNQCLEERVLYRLLSGLHASTTISIAYHYYPPAPRKNRTSWESNPTYFMQKFAHHEDYIRNLHFSYVVLLRALTKASKYLYRYQIRASGSNHVVDDETATVLLRRLLDSTILQSCASVFSAFDESLMFQQQNEQADLLFTNSGNRKNKQHLPVRTLQQQFKGVFHNVSSILDCVQCQQCKLHGKMAMLGYGTALRILFMNDDVADDSDGTPMMNRNEMVALINTLAKFSESIRHVRSLTQMYWTQQYQQQESNLLTAGGAGILAAAAPAIPSLSTININMGGTTSTATTTTSTVPTSATRRSIAALEHVDTAVGLIASLGKSGKLANVKNKDAKLEMELVQLALQRQPELLILAKHYAHDVDKFWTLLQQSMNVILSSSSPLLSTPPTPDAIIVGTGLAGLAAALNILDRGGRVVLLEKEHLLGGNSNKASSGINACCLDDDATSASSMEKKDSLDIFRNDTTRSAGKAARPELIERLVNRSAAAVSWLKTRVGVDLSLKSQLGGHSAKRTHRPSNGMAGAEIIYGMQKAVRAFEKTGHVQILVDTKVTQLLLSEHVNENGTKTVIGVEYHSTLDKDQDSNVASTTKLYAPNVILATGGFASDRSDGSYLAQNRPELLGFPTTAGAFSTGDG
jgi:Endoplasmic Reticulum Oxidoreductin 1 (ERO1)/FAD binding domain